MFASGKSAGGEFEKSRAMECPRIEETELDVGSASDELETANDPPSSRIRDDNELHEYQHRPTPRPFTIESLIGNRSQQVDSRNKGRAGEQVEAVEQDAIGSGASTERDRELLYRRHCLASALPGIFSLIPLFANRDDPARGIKKFKPPGETHNNERMNKNVGFAMPALGLYGAWLPMRMYAGAPGGTSGDDGPATLFPHRQSSAAYPSQHLATHHNHHHHHHLYDERSSSQHLAFDSHLPGYPGYPEERARLNLTDSEDEGSLSPVHDLSKSRHGQFPP